MPLRKPKKSEIGLSLIESLLAVMVLQVAVLGMIYTVNAGYAHMAEGDNIVYASRLGEELAEEILARAYEEPSGSASLGPDTGESSRADFDDIDDYHGYSEAAGSLLLFDGTDHDSELQEYSRSVTVTASTLDISDTISVSGKLVVVTVTYPSGRILTLSRFVKEAS